MKYVAFLDILGFKSKLKSLPQDQAERFISEFSSLLYNEWKTLGLQTSNEIQGYIVSDSIIINTQHTTSEALSTLLEYIVAVCRRSFAEKNILLRCAIAKGEYNQLPATGFVNLQKGLIVGQAYIDAYTMESASKTSAIIMSQEIKEDIDEFLPGQFALEVELGKGNNANHYLLKWTDINLLMNEGNLTKFIVLAVAADWIPLYYNTLYLCMCGNRNEKKQNQVFYDIFNFLFSNYDSSKSWREVDKFIENAFHADVNFKFKQMFLKFLRGRIEGAGL
ncbi:MAG: hypothetical protein EOM54_09845 [Clostridia bacterium]|nr:hypothetical protein [Clostridia bacterium]